MRFSLIAIVAISLVGTSGCTKVSKDHPINDRWEYVNFKLANGTVETYGADTTVIVEFANSNSITGIGPQADFEGTAEIWKDGAIQAGDLCCANITAGDSSLWKQVQFFNRITSSAKYEIFSNTLVLKNTMDGTELKFLKQ